MGINHKFLESYQCIDRAKCAEHKSEGKIIKICAVFFFSLFTKDAGVEDESVKEHNNNYSSEAFHV